MKKAILMTAITTFGILGGKVFSQTTYELDKNHAKLGFSVSHFGISQVEGHFTNFDVTMQSSKSDFADAQIEMTAEINSIDTDNDMRDKDLKSDNWFDAAKYPKMTFKSKSFKKTTGNKYTLTGDLTIKGVTKSVTLDVVYNGKSPNPMTKKMSAGFTVNGKVKRKDFNVGPTGASPVGDDIEIRSNVEFVSSEEITQK
jgi:polyisoprenoid-binding protein YceI